MRRVAFQGESGAYSEKAIQQFFGGSSESIPCETFADVFCRVERGSAEYGMIPVENSIAGSVNQSYELLMEHDLRIYAEVIFSVHHMLLGTTGATIESLVSVRSHPQALSQCRHYIQKRNIRPQATSDTASSAHDLAAHPDPTVGVIASRDAAQLSGLEILDRNIEDFPQNYTRFFVLSTEDPERAPRNKTSIIFTTPHHPGALYECLGEFAVRHISLSKLESRPRASRPWQYVFYLDFEGHCQDPECEAAISGLLRRSSFVKLLGSYPAATTPIDELHESSINDRKRGEQDPCLSS